MNYSILELFNYFGSLLCVILSIILLTKTKGTPAFRISLSMYLIVGSLIVTLGTMINTGRILFLPHLLQIDSPLHYLFIPLGFFLVVSFFKPEFKFKPIHLLHLLPFIFNLIEQVPFYMKSTVEKRAFYKSYFQTLPSEQFQFHSTIIIILGCLYFPLQLYVFKKYKQKNDTGKSKQYSILWFRMFLAVEGVLLTIYLFEMLTENNFLPKLYEIFVITLSIFLYYIALSLMFFPELLYNTKVVPDAIPLKNKYSGSKLNDSEKQVILNKLDDFLNNSEKPYLNPEISLNEVSLFLEVSVNRLSQVINELTGMNFNDYINRYRIDEAKFILLSPQYPKLTIEAIAKMAGFNSKSAFYAAFKKHSGMTPKEFISRK
jgi:AraC-like DNA-binding protein